MINEKIEDIQLRLTTYFKSIPPFNALNISPSNVADWLNMLSVFSTELFTMEQLMNAFETEIEAFTNQDVAGTALWIQNKLLQFQDGDVVQVNPDFTVGYATIDTSKRIITAAAVVPFNGVVNCKIATGSPLAPVSSIQLVEVASYLDALLPAGMRVNLISIPADVIKIIASIYFNGQYDVVIQANVIAALNSYLSLLPFNGVVKISDIEKIILNVAGVTDVVFTEISVTPNGGLSIYLVQSGTTIARNYQTYAGYLINASAPNDFANTLTFTVG